MSKPTIRVTPEELFSAAVEARVGQRAAVEQAGVSYRDAAAKPSRLSPSERSRPNWHSTFVRLTIFGLIGGLLAGTCGELLWSLDPDASTQAGSLLKAREHVFLQQASGELSESESKNAIRNLDDQGAANPYYRLKTATSLADAQRERGIRRLMQRDRVKRIVASLCLYCTWGTFIAASLGMAEALAVRNIGRAAVYGAVGAMLGLAGGAVLTISVGTLSQFISGAGAGVVSSARQIVAHSLSWGVLGLFLSVAPGLVMRSRRKLVLGMIGGFIGGAIGGAVFDPINRATNNDVLARIVAVAVIGMLTGLCIATVENVAKKGWLKVVEGAIAGKQFIIYHNPTIIGSHPGCEIFLYKDSDVLRHHAMMYIVAAGYVLEDLGSGSTLVNDQPIDRVHLRNGDSIRIGRTRFTFHETAVHRSLKPESQSGQSAVEWHPFARRSPVRRYRSDAPILAAPSARR